MTMIKRRSFLGLAAATSIEAVIPMRTATAASSADIPPVSVRTWTAGAEGVYRNIYAIETDTGFVAVDAPLRRSDAAAARVWLASLGKPLKAVLITHMHPDHNFGLTEMLKGTSVPIFATRAVAQAIRAGEEVYQRFVPTFIGDAETERERRFPDALVASGETVTIDGVPFHVRDIGEAESAADSIWSTSALPNALFSGDLVFHRVHTWVAQGATRRYLSALSRLQGEVDSNALFFAGHGGIAPAGTIARQLTYLRAYREAVQELAAGRPTLSEAEKQALVRRMMTIEPSPYLAFGISIGADAVARELAAGR